MSFAEPLVWTVNAIAHNLRRISAGNLTSKYRTTDGNRWLSILHRIIPRKGQQPRMNSRVTIEVRKPKADSPSDFVPLYITVEIDRPDSLDSVLGFTEAEIDKELTMVGTFIGTTANVTKLVGLES